MSWWEVLKGKARKPSFRQTSNNSLRNWANSRWDGRKPKHMPYKEERVKGGVKRTTTSTPKRIPKPKREIKRSNLIDNYFEMYRNQGRGVPTINGIQMEEGRKLTTNERNYYKQRKERK